MLRKDKNIKDKSSSDCLEKQSGEFTHRDSLNIVERLEEKLTDVFNIEKVENDK